MGCMERIIRLTPFLFHHYIIKVARPHGVATYTFSKQVAKGSHESR